MQTVLNITRNGKNYLALKGRKGYWVTAYQKGSNEIPSLLNPSPIADLAQAWQLINNQLSTNKN